jgi:hypothetical protein
LANWFDQFREGRTDLSKRREREQREQRERWGELAPGQRSINEPWRE